MNDVKSFILFFTYTLLGGGEKEGERGKARNKGGREGGWKGRGRKERRE